MTFDSRQDGPDLVSDDQSRGLRLDRRQMLVGLAAGGLGALAGCTQTRQFEADRVSIPSDDVEQFGLEQIEEDEIVVEEERTIGDEDIRAEMTSHAVTYEATGDTGGEARLRTTRDVAAGEVLVMTPGKAFLDADEDVVGELGEVGRLMLPGEVLVEDGEFIGAGWADSLHPAALVLFPEVEGDYDEGDLGELRHAIEDDVMPPHEGILLPKRGLLSEDLEAVPVEALEDALERGISGEHVGRLLENSWVMLPDPNPSFSNEQPELLEQGVVMIPGSKFVPAGEDINFIPDNDENPFIPGNDENPFIPGNDENPFDFADGDERIDVFDDGAALVRGTGGIEDRHEIDVGRLELLEQGGFILPEGSWEAVESDSAPPSSHWPLYWSTAVGALSTPEAEVMGNSLNPVADASPEELLTDEETRSFVGRLGLDGVADGWVEGPESVNTEVGRLLGEDAPVETFVGLTGSREDPEFAVVHVGRLETGDDTVFVTGTSTWGVDQVGRVFIGDDGYVSGSDLGESIETALDIVEAFGQS